MSAPGVYANDRRVVHHPDNGIWMVFDRDNDWTEYTVAQQRDAVLALIPDLFAAFDAKGSRVPGVAEGPFDSVVHALIGDPR